MTILIICVTMLISLGIICGTAKRILTCRDKDSVIFKIIANRSGKNL